MRKEKKSKLKKVYVAYTHDECGLPFFVTPYIDEMMEKTGVKRNTIHQIVCGRQDGSKVGYNFSVVYIEE